MTRLEIVAELQRAANEDAAARLVLADHCEETNDPDVAEALRCPRRGPMVAAGLNRPEVMRLWRDEVPERPAEIRTRVSTLTEHEIVLMAPWAQQWINRGFSTAPADRPLFEAAACALYRYVGLEAPAILWVPAPVVTALAGPIASLGLECVYSGATNDVVARDITDMLDGETTRAIEIAVEPTVISTVRTISDTVAVATQPVHIAVQSAVLSVLDHFTLRERPHYQINSAVRDVVNAIGAAAGPALVETASSLQARHQALQHGWSLGLGGQFDTNLRMAARLAFVLDSLGLAVDKPLELRLRAWFSTVESACWWWAHKKFIVVSERPAHLSHNVDNGYAVTRATWTWQVAHETRRWTAQQENLATHSENRARCQMCNAPASIRVVNEQDRAVDCLCDGCARGPSSSHSGG